MWVTVAVCAVISVGALDMINYNGIASVPDKFTTGSDRILFVHNAGVTLMRTNVEENVAMATHMVQQLQRAETDIVLLLPTGGVSVLDQVREANSAFQMSKDHLHDHLRHALWRLFLTTFACYLRPRP